MTSRMRSAFSCIALGALALAACADVADLTSPRQVSNEPLLLGEVLGGVESTVGSALVAPLRRSAPLAAPVSWSFTVGPEGAVSRNAATGLTISVPKNAVAQPVTITVTALEGAEVAYGFAPHGLRFARNVTLTQSAAGLDVGVLSGLLVQGAHFSGDAPLMTDGLALVTETVNAHVNLLQNSIAFPITHFSGWIVASGRSGEGGDAQ